VTLETGSMRILADAGGAPLHDVTTLSAVGAQADAPATDPWSPSPLLPTGASTGHCLHYLHCHCLHYLHCLQRQTARRSPPQPAPAVVSACLPHLLCTC
jgi:hypothetical protein